MILKTARKPTHLRVSRVLHFRGIHVQGSKVADVANASDSSVAGFARTEIRALGLNATEL